MCTPARFGRYLISYEPSPLSSDLGVAEGHALAAARLTVARGVVRDEREGERLARDARPRALDAACPLSTRGGTRLVRLVRGGGGGVGGDLAVYLRARRVRGAPR